MVLSRLTKPFKLGTDTWDPSHRFETSWLLNPWLLSIIRTLTAIYAFTALFFNLGWNCTHPSQGGCQTSRRSFSYFTVLTYWGLAFYFATAAAHTISYSLHGSRALLDRWPRALQALHSLYYTTIVTLPFLVTIVYWAILYAGPWFPVRFNAWSNTTEHALNSAFALFELVIPRTAPPPWIHLLWLIVILLGYLALAFVTLEDQGWYTYSFLDHDAVGGRGLVAGYVLGIAVAIVVIFAVVWALIRFRVWITETKFGCQGKFAQGRSGRGDDAEMGDAGNKELNRQSA